MKKHFIILSLLVLSLTACSKNTEIITDDTKPSSIPETTTIEISKSDPIIESDINFLEIDADNFITALKTNTTSYNMCTWGKKDTFVSNEKNFESYIIENVLGNAYIAISRNKNNTLSDIYMTCPRGTMTYYYATNIIYSIDETIDYKSILESLTINENDDELEGLHVMQPEGMDIVFERKEDTCVFSIMFYRSK